MKVLIITDYLPPLLSANSSIAVNLSRYLQEAYDAEIILLGLQTGSSGEVAGSLPFRVYEITELYEYPRRIPIVLPKFWRLIKLLAHPSLFYLRLRRSFARHPYMPLYRRTIKRVLREESNIDVIIAVSTPFEVPVALSKMKLSIPWISYRLDPWHTIFFYNGKDKAKKRAKRDEQIADRKCAAIFVQPAAYQEYLSGKNEGPLEKIHCVEFPNLRQISVNSDDPISWEEGYIHCVYAGQFYEDIRNPQFLLRLFSALKDCKVILHVIGVRADEKIVRSSVYGENIVFHGRVPFEQAVSCMRAADVLVNLGNAVTNLTPSKLFDYMSLGKPILNIYKSADCPTLRYAEKYPLCLSVAEEPNLTEETISRTAAFIRESVGRTIPFEDVKKIFPECTLEYVGEQLYRVLEEITKKTENRE